MYNEKRPLSLRWQLQLSEQMQLQRLAAFVRHLLTPATCLQMSPGSSGCNELRLRSKWRQGRQAAPC